MAVTLNVSTILQFAEQVRTANDEEESIEVLFKPLPEMCLNVTGVQGLLPIGPKTGPAAKDSLG